MTSASRCDGGEESLIQVGRIRSPAGLRGELHVELLSDVPGRFAEGREVLIRGVPYSIQRARSTPKGLLIKFTGIDSPQDAEELRNEPVFIGKEHAIPPPPGAYYHYQLLDMRVVTAAGDELGLITDVLQTGANDVYVVKGAERETLVPALADVVKAVDTERGVMVVDLPDGL